jgi:NPCBM/NEW2 domain
MRRPRQTRRVKLLPEAEVLECRQLLSADVGINLDADSNASNDPIWTDLRNYSFPWEAPNTTIGPAAPDTAIPLTADSYPLANAATTFNLTNYPNGNYQFSYTGTATVTFSDIGQLAGPVTVSGGVTSGTVIVNHGTGDGSYVDMQVSGVNAASPMDNFHLMMPGYGNGTTPEPMYTPAFLQSLAPFSTIRFMEWGAINGTLISSWSQRVLPTSFITDGPNGAPYEYMIELANEAQKDMWINVPALATPQFVQSLAQLIAANLDSNLKVYVEYSNETWNTSSPVFGQVLTLADANPAVPVTTNTLQMVEDETAYQTVAIGQTFDQAFGAGSSRVRPILASQQVYTVPMGYALAYIQQNYGPPAQFIYATGFAPYVTISDADNVSGLTLNQLFTDMTQYLDDEIIPTLQQDAAISAQYGLPMVAYEWGQGLWPGANDLNEPVMQQAQNDPRMYQIYLELASAWQQAGGGLFNAFVLDSEYAGQAGFWGSEPTVLGPGGQKYNALAALALPAGDANLDGVVDYADFEDLEANYGSDNAYWQEGDFNDDGTVNWQDLNILKGNLNPAGFTLAQFAQAAVFGQLSTVEPGQSLEYDGYGVTYASSLPFSASTGTIELNENSQGAPIVLAGVTYPEGLGVLAGSSVSLALNGQDSRFETTIGVDGSSNTGSSVIFDVYGDGTLLYQSSTMTYASGAVPIDINVAGVNTLTLVVAAATGTTPSSDNAVWADARLISTTNFGSVQPYTLTWQLSQNGTVVSTQTTDSFVFGALSGSYTLNLTVTNAQGATAQASTVVTVVPATATASDYVSDSFTQGQWSAGPYGTQGYDIAGGPSSIPNYATVTTSGASFYTWSPSTSDPRALDVDGGPFGVAATWYSSSSFTINVDMNDGQTHDLTLYAVDWEDAGRREEIQIMSAATGAVLGSSVISSFSGGVYLQWAVSGDIVIKVTNLGNPNAVISGLFFDPPTTGTTYVTKADGTTLGNWIGNYGSQAYYLAGGAASIPSYAQISTVGASTYYWAASTTDPRALQNPNGSGRAAITWFSPTSFTVDVNLTDGQVHDLELYFVDWDAAGRVETVTISNASTGAVLDSKTISSFAAGEYLQFPVSGDIVITVTDVAAVNAVLNGIFLDAAGAATASLIRPDTTTQGTWINTYGAQGYDIIGSTFSVPSYASITTAGAQEYTWAPITTNPLALQTAGGSSRVAAALYSSTSFTVEVNLSDGQVHDLELYFLGWDDESRVETVSIANADTGTVLDFETVSSFTSGVYLDWAVSGNLLITITDVSGPNAVLSGLFLDSVIPSTGAASASLVGRDTTTQGNWINTYGAQGYDVIGNTSSLPSYASITPVGYQEYTWASSTTNPLALQTAGGSSRVAATLYSSTSFTVHVNLSDGQVHDLELYFLGWDGASRVETVTIASAGTGTVLNTETVSSFSSSGVYLDWAVSGNLLITITDVSGPNAVLSGLFLDPAITSTGVASASLVGRDTTTHGTWINTYGAQGYDVIGNTSSVPSYASITPAGAQEYTWASSTTSPLGLQTAGGSSRVAAAWYSSTSFTVDVDLSDGQVHDLELYFADWYNQSRAETVTISNAATRNVLDTETVSSFASGVYLEWAVSGNLLITVTCTSGPNAVLSGLFLDPAGTLPAVVATSLGSQPSVATDTGGITTNGSTTALGIVSPDSTVGDRALATSLGSQPSVATDMGGTTINGSTTAFGIASPDSTIGDGQFGVGDDVISAVAAAIVGDKKSKSAGTTNTVV